MPPFYVQATFTNKVYRFEQLKKQGGIGNYVHAQGPIKEIFICVQLTSIAWLVQHCPRYSSGMASYAPTTYATRR